MAHKKNVIEEIHTDPFWYKLASVLKMGNNYEPWQVALRIMSIYLLLGCSWILLSDKAVERLIKDKETMMFVSMIKGWCYVFVTGGMIFLLIFIVLQRIKVMEQELNKNYDKLKIAYDELVELENFNQSTMNCMMNAFALHRIILNDAGEACDYEYINVNPAFVDFTGLKKEEVIGKRYTEIMPEASEDSTDWIALYGEIALTGKSFTIERYTEAFAKWVRVNAYSPQKGYFVTVFQDITESRRNEQDLKDKNKELSALYDELSALYEELTASEEELRRQLDEIILNQKKLTESEERFHLAVEGSNDMIWDVDLTTNNYYFSERWREFLGYDANEEGISFKDWSTLLHPDDIAQTETATRNHFAGKTPFYSCEFRLKTKNEGYKWFYSTGKAMHDSIGNVIRFAASL